MRLGAGQAVASRRVPVEQGAAGGQFVSDGVDRATHPGRVGVLDAEQRQDEQGCVQVSGAIAAGVAAHSLVEATCLDLDGNGVACDLPASVLPGGQSMSVGDAQGTVQGEPTHELGVHVVGGVVSDLPDAGVRLTPPAGDQVGETAHGPPCLGVEVVPGLHEHPRGVQDPAVPVELVLFGCAVAHPHRQALGVAGPAAQVALRGVRGGHPG
jgi:hypothetical protein